MIAQVCALEFGSKRYCLIAIDHIGFSRKHADILRDRVAKLISATRSEVMLCFSHTHSGPNEDIELEWRETTTDKICAAVECAFSRLHSVKAGWGNAYGDIGFNRRTSKKGIDRRIGILKFSDAATDKVCLAILRCTAHANVLKRDNYMISPDYFGAVRKRLEKQLGCPVIVTQGASGNVAPKYVRTELELADTRDDCVVRSVQALEKTAEEIAKQVEKFFDGIETEPINNFEIYSKYIDLYSEVSDILNAKRIAAESGMDGTDWLIEVNRLRDAGISEQKDTTEVQFFTLNRGCFCGVPNEIMTEFALEVREKTRNEFCYFGGYTNGISGYFPIAEEFDRGGYEVYWSMLIYYKYFGRVFPLRRSSAEELVTFVCENLKKCHSL